MRRLFQIAAWLLLAIITLLSVVPPGDRPVTPAPHDVEHAAVFAAMGLAFGFGYARRYLLQALGLLGFCAAIELAQLGVPGRHARVSDFVVDALSVSVGIAVAFVLDQAGPYLTLRR